MTPRPDRPALRYFGSKWSLGPWIESLTPQHDAWVAPFAGSASEVLRKRRSNIEVLNDANHTIINFHRVLRDRREELEVKILATPYSREELARALEPSDDELEQARRTYVVAWQTRGGGATSGWRFQRSTRSRKDSPLQNFYDVSQLEAVQARLLGVFLECSHAFECIARWDGRATLYYVDPPYLAECRNRRSRGAYGKKLDFATADEHRALAEQLHAVRGMVLLSGRPSKLYEELFESRGWIRRDTRVQTSANTLQTESVWLNPAAQRAPGQPLPLPFGNGNESGADAHGGVAR